MIHRVSTIAHIISIKPGSGGIDTSMLIESMQLIIYIVYVMVGRMLKDCIPYKNSSASQNWIVSFAIPL